MATRAGLDASHASKSITAWREKKPSYKGKLNRICRGMFSLRLILLGLCAFSTVLQSIFSLSLGVLVTDLSVGAPPAVEAPPWVFRFPEEALVVWTWRARGVKLMRRFVTRQRFGAKSTGRINTLHSNSKEKTITPSLRNRKNNYKENLKGKTIFP